MKISLLALFAALLAFAVPGQTQTQTLSTNLTRIFDGKSLEGWEGNRKVWRVADGAIVGGTLETPISKSDYLCTAEEFENFELRASARITRTKGGRNAGVAFRSQRVPNSHEVGGYQADMGFAGNGDPIWGSLLDEFRPEPSRYPDPARPYRFLAMAARDVVDRVLRPDGWNDVVVVADGPRVQLWLNGVATVDFVEHEKVPSTGKVCLQVHSGPPEEAWYKDISIRRVLRSSR